MHLPWTTRLYHFLKGPNPLHPSVWHGRLSPLSFRCFNPSDLPACLELYTLNEPGRFPEGVKRQYEQWLKAQRDCVLVAEREGRVIASGGISRVFRENIAILCFGLVHPAFQGRGFGAALVLARLALLNPSTPAYAVLICAVPQSIGYYRRLGFRPGSPWKDPQGQNQPSAHLAFTAREIERCRALLAKHKISIPEGDDLVPFNNQHLESKSRETS